MDGLLIEKTKEVKKAGKIEVTKKMEKTKQIEVTERNEKNEVIGSLRAAPTPFRSACLYGLFGWLCVFFFLHEAKAQSNNALSIFEGERIVSVSFRYENIPADTTLYIDRMQQVENAFLVYPYTHFNQVMTDYYLTRIRLLPFVETADADIISLGEGGIALIVRVVFSLRPEAKKKPRNLLKDIHSFPVIYADNSAFLTFRISASEMGYSDNDAWFARPEPLLKGNPLVDHPAGAGYTGWVEGFAMGGVYGIVPLLRPQNIHLYGGANYIVSFSAGRELFTDKSRFYGHVDDAFAGLVGGDRTSAGHEYAYNILYGRKQYILGNGWLITNTAMNGEERGALQLNPRRAAKRLFQAGARWDKLVLQGFSLQPNELPLLDSHTILDGLNLEWGNSDRIQAAATVIHSPRSDVKYYLPDGTTHTRKGLWVYNLRLFGNPALNRAGLFYKSEFGLQTNNRFPMRAYAWYIHAGWNFAQVRGKPALSYRFAYFSGDNPATSTYERWDALYTGGNGEQWVQGSNMYKIVQNSNEMTHLLQLIYTPWPKWQTVTQLWSFIAPQKNNLGGNPALSTLKSRYYGSEVNLTVKYFYSRRWYFHFNTALTFPGNGIREVVPGARNWFCLMAFAQYTL